mgnify:CR=1 FL=1
MANPRKTAVSVLTKIEKDNAYSNITLKSFLNDAELTHEDIAFVSALVYGVLDRRITLDYVLSRFMKTPLKKTAPFTLNVLRTALYQIMFMDKIPESAAVNEAVKIMKSSKFSRNAGFVNGVLRSVLRTDVDLDSPQGRKLALADNSVTQADLVWDDKKLADMAQKFGIDLSEWKMKIAKLVADKDNKVQTIINDEKELKLVFTPEQYSFVLNALRRYGDDFTQSILKVLKIDE